MNDDDFKCDTCELIDCECLDRLTAKYGMDVAVDILSHSEDYTDHDDYLEDEI